MEESLCFEPVTCFQAETEAAQAVATVRDNNAYSEFLLSLHPVLKAFEEEIDVADGQLLARRSQLGEEVKAFVEWCAEPSIAEQMHRILEGGELYPSEQCLRESKLVFTALVHNTVDSKHEHYHSRISSTGIRLRQARRTLEFVEFLSRAARQRDQRCMPPLLLMQAVENEFVGASHRLVRRQTKTRQSMSSLTIRKYLDSVRGWTPAPGFETSRWYTIFADDNLDFWSKKVFAKARNNDGSKDNEMIATTTGEVVRVPRSLSGDALPPALEVWPFLGEWDQRTMVMSKQQIRDFIQDTWKRLIEHCGDDPMQIFSRPDPARDKGHGRDPTFHFAKGIAVDCGTASYEHVKQTIERGRSYLEHEDQKVLWYGDQQTFSRMWWTKYRQPEANQWWCPLPGEFHCHCHAEDCVVQLHWDAELEVLLMMLGVKNTTKKLVMKQHSCRMYWLNVILAGAFAWIQEFAPDFLDNPLGLLDRVKNNKPAASIIGFVVHHLAFLWAYKDALRTHDNAYLDESFRYMLLMYGPTAKTNYKKYMLQAGKCVNDMEPTADTVRKGLRTFTSQGVPGTGQGMDAMVEMVV